MVTSACADIMFIFSPSYLWVWEKNRSLIRTHVSCGYIPDYAFRKVREDALSLRRQIFANGAKFIICFFDENSSDDRRCPIPSKRSEKIYRYFIEKVLQDKTLGLVCKPKKPKSLFARVSGIGDLLVRAKESGRCVFLDKGTKVSSEKHPAEAAQAADVCIGLLLGGTVALESYLSGVPTVFLDLEKLYHHPIYQWGRGKVVFDDIDSLYSAIEQFRKDKSAILDFGNLSRWADDKDAFKDGKASLRMGEYISRLFSSLREGKGRDNSIRYANRQTAKQWGDEVVFSDS